MKGQSKLRLFRVYIRRPDGIEGCWDIKATSAIAAEIKAEKRIGRGGDKVIRVEEVGAGG